MMMKGQLSFLTVEEMCRKLRPLLGKDIDKIYMKYSLTDDRQKRTEIEQALNALYQRYLNSTLLSEKVLLPPPQAEVIKGKYSLGNVTYADKELYPFGLREQDWVRHVCISGMSGSGKTNFAYQILGNFVLTQKPFLVFDWKKSFRPLTLIEKQLLVFTVGNNKVSNMFRMNINRPPKGVDPREWINFLADLINEAFSTSFGVHKILVETLDRAFTEFGVYNGSDNYPTWFHIKKRLEQREEESGGRKSRESEWLTSAQRIAHTMTFGAFGDVVSHQGSDAMKVEDLFTRQVLFELHALDTVEKKFFCEFMLGYIYKYKKHNSEQVDGFTMSILVDEAHNIFLKERANFVQEGVTDVIYREIREYGISLICLDQHISKLSDTVAGNSATNIAFQQVLPKDIEVISSLMGIRDERKYFSMLPVGQAIVYLAERYHLPFTISVPLVALKKKDVSDSMITGRMNRLMAAYAKRQRERDAKKQAIKQQLREEAKAGQLQNVFRHSGVDISIPEARQQVIAVPQQPAQLPKKPALPPIRNHLQADLADQIREMLASNSVRTVKAYFTAQGFKNTDINRAVKRCLQEPLSRKPGKHVQLMRVTPEEKAMLFFLYKYPRQNTSEAYEKLNLSARKGTMLKKRLLAAGLIHEEEVRDATGWRKQLVVDKKFERMLAVGEQEMRIW
ncbi:MAG TPA: DUF87 domain-containing protein [Candidatus Nanoarchaeia archaeon]|nr:DUF87 domain-containing protein [Candidatus Nanoarchaeia archaeon]